MLTLRGATPREDWVRQPLCADIDGFSLHAAVRVQAHDRKRLEQLCRYITRPSLSDERVQLNAAGQVELKLKTPWRDGTTHLVMAPLEFMQRLAALVPRPRLHLMG
ncbi:MAG: transposase [Betaproteobacteria bacterium]